MGSLIGSKANIDVAYRDNEGRKLNDVSPNNQILEAEEKKKEKKRKDEE